MFVGVNTGYGMPISSFLPVAPMIDATFSQESLLTSIGEYRECYFCTTVSSVIGVSAQTPRTFEKDSFRSKCIEPFLGAPLKRKATGHLTSSCSIMVYTSTSLSRSEHTDRRVPVLLLRDHTIQNLVWSLKTNILRSRTYKVVHYSHE